VPQITPARFAAAFEFGRKVLAGQVTEAQAVERLVAEYGMDAGSADGYVRQLEHFLNGVAYTRTINDPATRYYLENIAKDFGNEGLQNSLNALRGHIEYYEVKASKRPGLRFIQVSLLEYSPRLQSGRASATDSADSRYPLESETA
jgi:hypothetical protein